MTYNEALDYLYSRLPMFTRDGASAFKKDLTNTVLLCQALDNPQNKFKSVHIAGTNGKGSSSHMLAAILQCAGYKTGLYTSPHLVDFRERIKINGEMIPKKDVVAFVTNYRRLIEDINPSFFEVTVALAFQHFSKHSVDVAIIETGLGGKLDSTNIIRPILSIITNIGYDHMNMLGNTLEEIATEKAGIIKQNAPIIINQSNLKVDHIFKLKALELQADLYQADQNWKVIASNQYASFQLLTIQSAYTPVPHQYRLGLQGSYQKKNILGVLEAVRILRTLGIDTTEFALENGLSEVRQLTGLMGRWQTLASHPKTICDTGHNEDGWQMIVQNIQATPHQKLHMVIGVMQDKDLNHMLPLLPVNAQYYFCAPNMKRALNAETLSKEAEAFSLSGQPYHAVASAIEAAQQAASIDDLIFIGGSTFVVAEALPLF